MSQKKSGIILSYVNLFAKNIVILLYTPILLRFLGQSEYGLYQIANNIISSLTLLNMGFGTAYIRFFSIAKSTGDEKRVNNLNGLYLILFLFMSLISLIIGIMIVFFIPSFFSDTLEVREIRTLKYLMLLMVFNVSISFVSSVFDSNILANQQFRFQRSRQLVQTVLAPILTIPLLLNGYKSISIVIVQTAITIVFFFLNIRFSRKKLNMKFEFNQFDRTLMKNIAYFSFFIFLNQLIDQINWNLPNFFIGKLLGANEVAIFAVANQIKNLFISLSTTLSGVFVPEINNIVSTTNDNNKLLDIMIKVGKLQSLVLSFVLGGYLLLGEYFVNQWAGESYSEAYILSLLLVLPFLVTLIQNTGYEIIRAKNLHKFRASIEFIFSILNVFVTIFAIREYGLYGATFGTIITMLSVSLIIMNIYYHKRVQLNMVVFWKNILPIYIPMIVSYSVCKIILNFFSINSLSFFVMFGLLYVFIYGVVAIILEFQKIKLIIKLRKQE